MSSKWTTIDSQKLLHIDDQMPNKNKKVLALENSYLFRKLNIYWSQNTTDQSICETTQQPVVTNILR
jgi:hypothetical protein